MCNDIRSPGNSVHRESSNVKEENNHAEETVRSDAVAVYRAPDAGDNIVAVKSCDPQLYTQALPLMINFLSNVPQTQVPSSVDASLIGHHSSHHLLPNQVIVYMQLLPPPSPNNEEYCFWLIRVTLICVLDSTWAFITQN